MSRKSNRTVVLMGFVFSVVVLMTSSVNAQDCASILKDGIFDIGSTTGDTTLITTAFNWMRQKNYRNVQEAIDGGVKFTGISFGGGKSLSNVSLYEAEQIIRNSANYRGNFSSSFRQASPVITGAWSKCMEQQGSGFRFSMYSTDDPRIFRLILKFNPIKTVTSAALNEEPSIPVGIICTPLDTLKKGLVVDFNGKEFSCTRNTDRAGSIILNSDAGPASVDLKEIPKPPVPPETISLDVNLCSGSRCNPGSFRPGQLVTWEKTRAATLALGPQLNLPDDIALDVFCKAPSNLTASEFEDAVVDVGFQVVGNKNEATYFDLDLPIKGKFKADNGGRFYFANDANGDHGIEGILTLTLRPNYCPPKK